MSYRPKRVAQSAVNTPTAVHVNSSSIIPKSEAESILSEFIATSESIATTIPGASNDEVTFSTTGLSNSTGINAILSQLRRVQRDLRGLPPLLADFGEAKKLEEAPTNKKIKFDDDDEVNEEPVNKKIKFDEEPVDAEEEEDVQQDEPITYDPASEDEAEPEKIESMEVTESPKKEKKHKKEKKDKKHKKEKKSKSE